MEEIRKMAKFLGVPENEDLFRAIHEKCRFEKLSVEKPYNPERAERVFNPGFKMFRKGEHSVCTKLIAQLVLRF